METLRQLFAVRRTPRFIRSDNGPEFVARAVRDWLAESGVETLTIEPGSPWENGYCESFNSRLRDEFLNRELFMDLREAKVVVEAYRLAYPHRRPHSALGYRTPAAFAATQEPGGHPTATRAQASPLRLAPLACGATPEHAREQKPTLITAGT